MAVNRYYSSTAQETTLSSGISNSDTSITVGGLTGWPVSFPYTAIIDRGTASEEVVTITAAASTTVTATRAADGTSAVSHSAGATFQHGVSARDHREAQEHIAATTGVHGLAGGLVGTSDSQTLSNKTLTAPTINTPTISGGSWTGSPSISTPTIADLTNMQHDHSAASKGGNIPQSSVTGLSSALTTITNTNNTQDTNISTLQGQMTTANTNISNNSSAITTLQNATTGLTWTSYTPTLTASGSNPSLGPGFAREGEWCAIGKIGFVRASFKFGTGGGIVPGSGTYRISLPFTPKTLTVGRHIGSAYAFDDSANDVVDGICWTEIGNWTQVNLVLNGSLVTNAVPWTWAALDAFGIYLTCELA